MLNRIELYRYFWIDTTLHSQANRKKKAIEKANKGTEKNITLVTEYHPNLPSLSKIVRKHWEVMVDHDPRLHRIFPKPSVVAYSRGKNLKDLLM